MSRCRAGRPEAAEAIWSARGAAPTSAPGASARRIRVRAALQGLAIASAGALAFTVWSRTLGAIALGLGALVLAAGLASPTGAFRLLELALAAAGRATGRALGLLLLVPLFYGFFWPFGRLRRRGRQDRLARFREPDAASYWEPHRGPRAGSGSALRQY
jgi:hypothetical protein